MKQIIRQWIRKLESGIDVSFQGIAYISIMVVLMGLVWDFGRLAYIHSICLNAARVAAQDAAKSIDRNKFLNDQEVDLLPSAQADAELMFKALTDISVNVNVQLVDAADAERGKFVHVSAEVPVKMFMLGSLFEGSRAGRPNDLRTPITIRVEAYAEPAYGIDEEIQ
jgi:hypothetical protein